eukprot:2613043-Alexandrium_andersonii.AAC.1
MIYRATLHFASASGPISIVRHRSVGANVTTVKYSVVPELRPRQGLGGLCPGKAVGDVMAILISELPVIGTPHRVGLRPQAIVALHLRAFPTIAPGD